MRSKIFVDGGVETLRAVGLRDDKPATRGIALNHPWLAPCGPAKAVQNYSR